ncbi:DNA ligase 1-like isoform X6 [Gossypium australe]|uniref:DNA ligase 1-like isoform X6 n=1 Tax=Gossypium australe TaxID=47621 RepID=A0A5B6VI78_9ROSI|nr:DNA ligase 1-like isoform X6 [Gossypium australe]
MQILSRRARKNVLLSDIKVDVCIFAFDILYLNGQALLQEQLEIRKEIGDTLDLVPVAAFHEKRTGVCGSFLLACYDDNNEEYQGICQIGIGFTEAVCEECSASLRSKVIPEPKGKCHVWFEAAELWSEGPRAAHLFAFNNAMNLGVPFYSTKVLHADSILRVTLVWILQLLFLYKLKMTHLIPLHAWYRFARIVRSREDKTPEQATSTEQIAEMYNDQNNNEIAEKDDCEDDPGIRLHISDCFSRVKGTYNFHNNFGEIKPPLSHHGAKKDNRKKKRVK